MSDWIAYGDYYLLGRLGTGGTAEVFLGKRLGDGVGGPLLAVKRLLTQFAGNPELIKSFQDEARIASVLRHPNIVEVIDAGVNNKQQFLVMEFIHGKDLKTIQRRARKTSTRVPYVASAYIAAAIADALDYAHELVPPEGTGAAVVHRDLSPQKILVSYEGVPKVIDFSARDAKSRGIEGRIGSIKGRFGYLSPEQATSNPADRRSDVFSLGVILYEMTTGMAPFRGSSDASTLGKVTRASFSPPELVNAGIPRVLGKIIERAMAREPEKRYATAGEMAEALRIFIRDDGQPIDKAELARFMRELFFEDYEREKVRVEEYQQLTPMAPAGSGSKPVPMGDTGDGSRTSNAQDERTTADDRLLASIEDDDDTGVSAASGDPIGGAHERTDTGITEDVPDTGIHRDTSDTGVYDVAAKADDIATPRREAGDAARGTADFDAPIEQLTSMPFEPTPSVTSASPPPATVQAEGDFNFTSDEVMPKLADELFAPAAKADMHAALANPWATEHAPPTATFAAPPAVLGEGPTVVATTLFGEQGSAESLFQIKTPSGKSPSVFDEKTKVYDGVADLVRRTQPSGFGVEVTKPDKAPAGAAHAQISEVLAAVSPLAVATTVEGLHVATTVQPLHVATVIATPPEKAVTEVAQAQASAKKKSRALSKLDDGDTEADKLEDEEFLDDEVFAKAGPLPDDVDMNAPATTAAPVPGAILREQPDDLEEYEEVGRFFSRSDMVTLLVAAVMGLLIMTASYVYALNVPLPDQDTIVEER